MKIQKCYNFATNTIADRNNAQFYLTQPLYNAESYAVSQFNSVNTFYTIDARNNALQFVETASPGTIRNVFLPQGNYIISTMLSTLSALMTAQSTGTITASNSTLKNRISITSTVEFVLKTTNSNCYYEIGFEKFSSTFALTQIAESSFDLSGVKCLNVCSLSFGYNNNITVNRNQNIICSIPITVPYTGVISYTPPLVYINSQLSEIQTVEFYVLDERFRPLTIDKDYMISILFTI